MAQKLPEMADDGRTWRRNCSEMAGMLGDCLEIGVNGAVIVGNCPDIAGNGASMGGNGAEIGQKEFESPS